ncbi:TPA: hypothetical protein NJ084_004681 [Vibrio parahaemolyticus]|nr:MULTISPECIES: hypothetical protein [Vibrio harveyi group]MCR9608026.1 hypothetical protein [Vibrio alginolyticus]ELA6986473.1 hypothetical protein [Vibrio parahaemolyticus]MBE3705387.1 hypothetical protein [Vibrio parahaemolyticus]MBE3770477.1 hypothetical protein [Vibrio parahaemolyticus]MCR9611954.1 hypothetical protein [Vibrio alginolyticus]
MFMTEDRVRLVASQFMPKLKKESVDAMVDVASNGLSVLASATKQGLSHQALSKNLVKLEQLQHKIVNTASKLSSAYVLEQNAHALNASETNFDTAKAMLIQFNEVLGGTTEDGYLGDGVKLNIEGKVLCLFRNPDDTFESEWGFDVNEAE